MCDDFGGDFAAAGACPQSDREEPRDCSTTPTSPLVEGCAILGGYAGTAAAPRRRAAVPLLARAGALAVAGAGVLLLLGLFAGPSFFDEGSMINQGRLKLLVFFGIIGRFAWEKDGSNLSPNDLWGIHDLLMTGYTGVFIQDNAPAVLEARYRAVQFAKLLPRIHPVAKCRSDIKREIQGVGDQKAIVVKAAKAALQCLPLGFTDDDFYHPYTEQGMTDKLAMTDADMPKPKKEWEGCCKLTMWPRTCSYWSSLHALAARADYLDLGPDLLRAVVPLIASGATMCAGCTLHFRAMYSPVLSPDMVEGIVGKHDLGCPNHQCAEAHWRMNDFVTCTSDTADKSDTDCAIIQGEIDDILNFQKYIEGVWLKNPSATAVLVSTHNFISATIDMKELYFDKAPHYFCVNEALAALANAQDPALELKGHVHEKCQGGGCEANLLGLGPDPRKDCSGGR